MDIKEFAKLIDGRENGYEIFSKQEIEIAQENGFIIVYGYSDDLMEFEGAMRDEGACYGGGNVYFSKHEVCQSDDDISEYKNCIKAIWYGREKDENGKQIGWTYETGMPHETFMIYEDGEPYCKGIVFSIDNLK